MYLDFMSYLIKSLNEMFIINAVSPQLGTQSHHIATCARICNNNWLANNKKTIYIYIIFLVDYHTIMIFYYSLFNFLFRAMW